jgi:hypothetical protein
MRGSSDRQIATDSVELRRTLASCAGPPAWSGACPPGRASRGGTRDMVAASSPVIACSPGRACPHSPLLIPLFRFLTSDFQFLLASALSTVNCLLSRLESALTRIGPIRPRKSFGMREPVEKVASIRVFKCFRMCALKMRAFVTYLECAFTKNPGGAPCVQRWKIGGRSK